jgi:hypothetical protein
VTLREHSYPRSSEPACRSSVHLGVSTSLQGIFAPDRAQTHCAHGCRVLYCGGYGGLRSSGSVEMVFAKEQRQ